MYCQCCLCRMDREQNCINLDACMQEAKKRVKMIPLKLNLMHLEYHHGNLSLTRRRRDQNAIAKTMNNTILFDPMIMSKENLAECFKIFTDPTKMSNELVRCHQDLRTHERHLLVQVFTNGACFINRKKNAHCRSGIWYRPDNKRN